MTNLFALDGAVALVTGSSRGIGRELAIGFGRAGATVVVHGRDTTKLDSTLVEIRALAEAEGWAGAISASSFDVTAEAEVDRAIDGILEEHGRLDVLVNNAGITHREPLVDVSLDDWNRVIETNLTGAFLVGRSAAQPMLAQGSGSIINICSVQTDLARPTIAPYVAAKGGLRNLTRAMTAEWASRGVRVNGIAPGYIATELTAPLIADEDFNSWITGRTPAGRWGAVADLVGPAVFLASDAAAFVHGQVLFVDGGMTVVV